MSRTDIIEKLNDIFRDVFDNENVIVDESTTAMDVEEWDSLTHIMLLSAIENEFDINYTV